ncbi:MAG TPA: BNR-4 repeat-containing protein, partial [Actinophytocola sp.]|uniref:BNR-4 repeat-containing protein n=1 Tax=Actinophytocola sp. TaxID=1872138 RepID=UPI002DDD11EC
PPPPTAVAARTDRRPVAGGLYDRVAGATFISWGGRNEDSYVQAYDHRTRTWSAPTFVVGGRGDSHNYPTMVQAADGHVLIVVGMHNGETVVARSPRPHAVDGAWTSSVVPAGAAASYPMPFRTARGELFVFFRETSRTLDPSVPSDTRPLLYMRSRDNGRTWQSSREITGEPFALGSTDRADNLNEIYMGQLRYDPGTFGTRERVHLVWTLAGGGPDQHLHDWFHKDIHYATFDPNTLRFHDVLGNDLGARLDDADQERRCKVVVTPFVRPAGQKSPDYIQQVGTVLGRRPFVLWFGADDAGVQHNRVSRWTGRDWRTDEVATGIRTRDIERLDALTWRVYATRDGQPNIETYLLTAGRFWRPETVISTPRPVQRIEVIGNFRDPARILATGAASAREVTVADGDVYVAGRDR